MIYTDYSHFHTTTTTTIFKYIYNEDLTKPGVGSEDYYSIKKGTFRYSSKSE